MGQHRHRIHNGRLPFYGEAHKTWLYKFKDFLARFVAIKSIHPSLHFSQRCHSEWIQFQSDEHRVGRVGERRENAYAGRGRYTVLCYIPSTTVQHGGGDIAQTDWGLLLLLACVVLCCCRIWVLWNSPRFFGRRFQEKRRRRRTGRRRPRPAICTLLCCTGVARQENRTSLV